MRDQIPVVSLDIGSAKTTVCIGNLDNAGRVEIYTAVMVKTRGLERGIITNLGEVASGIEEALRKAEAKFYTSEHNNLPAIKKNFRIGSVYVTISGEHVLGNNTKAMLSLSNRSVEITHNDSQRAIDSAKSLTTSIDREILHALAQEFVVDGYKRTKEPLGIFGTRLGVNLHIISCGVSFANSLVKAVNRAGFDVDGIVYSGLATSMAILTEEEKQTGVILLELGAGTTNILFFIEGSLQYTSVIPLGGNDITKEISQRLGIDEAQAEQLKMQYKNVCVYSGSNHQECDDKLILKKNSSSYESISRQELALIVDAKLGDLFTLVKKELDLVGITQRAKGGIIISGGMSFMDGIIEKLEEYIKLPVHLGIMRGFVSGFSGLSNSFYATGIGLIMHALNERTTNVRTRCSNKGILGQLLSKLRGVYEEYF
ncbi:MAG: cell division protein FtsA [Candidatus Omnitrophota bacterium]